MTLSKPATHAHPGYWRGVWVLAGKDIVDGFKNRTILTILLGMSFMILSVQALPLLLKLDERPRVAIYDGSRTRVADLLRRDGAVQISELRQSAQLADAARSSSGTLLAVELPQGWTESSGPLTIDGYIGHWVTPDEAAATVQGAEAALQAVAGRGVTIILQTVYPTAETGGHAIMVALGFVLVVTMVTSIVVPYLLLEEKTGHTLEMLRISPVTESQIVLGKGLAGMIFGLLAVSILMVINVRLVHFWDVLLFASALGILFGASLGLLVGTLVHDEGGVQLWMGLVSILLLAPLMSIFVSDDRLPAWVRQLFELLPPVTLFEMVRMAFYENRTPAELLLNGALLLIVSAALLGIVTWRLRRWETA